MSEAYLAPSRFPASPMLTSTIKSKTWRPTQVKSYRLGRLLWSCCKLRCTFFRTWCTNNYVVVLPFVQYTQFAQEDKTTLQSNFASSYNMYLDLNQIQHCHHDANNLTMVKSCETYACTCPAITRSTLASRSKGSIAYRLKIIQTNKICWLNRSHSSFLLLVMMFYIRIVPIRDSNKTINLQM